MDNFKLKGAECEQVPVEEFRVFMSVARPWVVRLWVYALP